MGKGNIIIKLVVCYNLYMALKNQILNYSLNQFHLFDFITSFMCRELSLKN